MLKLITGRSAEAGKISPLMIVLIAVVCVMLVGLLILVIGGVFVYQKAKDAGLDADLLREKPGLAVAKMAAAMNSDIEVVSVDEDAGRITLLDKESGKTVTMSLKDVTQGRISFETEDGETSTLEITGQEDQGRIRVESSEGAFESGETSGSLPDWIPPYPGAAVQGGMSGQTAEGQTGQVMLSISDPPIKVIEFYSEALKKAGLEVNTVRYEESDEISAMISAEGVDKGRRAIIMIGKGEGGTTASISFTEGK